MIYIIKISDIQIVQKEIQKLNGSLFEWHMNNGLEFFLSDAKFTVHDPNTGVFVGYPILLSGVIQILTVPNIILFNF